MSTSSDHSEANLVKQAITYLESMGWIPIRVIPGIINLPRYKITGAKKGTSDLICCSPNGRFYAFEFKVGKNKLSKSQQEFLTSVNTSKGKAFAIYSMEELKAIVQSDSPSFH